VRRRLAELLADLRALPDRQREALVMRELGDLSFRDIAQALECTEAAARQTVFEARTSLAHFDAGRDLSCASVQRSLSDRDNRLLRTRRVRAHIRGCHCCRAFDAALRTRRSDFALLLPTLAGPGTGLVALSTGAALRRLVQASAGGAAAKAAALGMVGILGAGAAGAALTGGTGSGGHVRALRPGVGAGELTPGRVDRSGPLGGSGGGAGDTAARRRATSLGTGDSGGVGPAGVPGRGLLGRPASGPAAASHAHPAGAPVAHQRSAASGPGGGGAGGQRRLPAGGPGARLLGGAGQVVHRAIAPVPSAAQGVVGAGAGAVSRSPGVAATVSGAAQGAAGTAASDVARAPGAATSGLPVRRVAPGLAAVAGAPPG
jgi:hypothetical protein